MWTVTEAPTLGRLSSALALNSNSVKGLNGGALAAPTSTLLIRMCADALQWAIDGNYLTDQEIRSLINYLQWLSGFFGFEAQNLIGSGGSVSTIVPGALRPTRIDFTVTDSSLFPTGSTGGSISQFIGYNLDFIRGGMAQSQVTSEPTYFLWNRATGVLFISTALSEGELVSLIPV